MTLSVTIQDLGEPGARVDRIKVEDITDVPRPPPTWPPTPTVGILWIGTINPNPPPAYRPEAIDGGNFQVHNIK